MTHPDRLPLPAPAGLAADWQTSGGCSYYLSQPAPDQWVAVGKSIRIGEDQRVVHRFVVGAGPTEAAAVSALECRCLDGRSGYRWLDGDGHLS